MYNILQYSNFLVVSFGTDTTKQLLDGLKWTKSTNVNTANVQKLGNSIIVRFVRVSRK